jgi:4-amino-4-deoxy-L-arabinose transferase-like glycosyltransferase
MLLIKLPQSFLQNTIKTNPSFFAGISLVLSWVVLYTVYLITHNIPANPGGYYLESAQQLFLNNFFIPAYVQGFGPDGIPFVYPPFSFYVLAFTGYFLGGILGAALYIPGILLLVQAILIYFFMKHWTGSKEAPLWATLILLLMPQIFLRTMFADGITTGLAGIFLLASWIMALSSFNKLALKTKSILGGFFIGLAILSHPALGLFAVVSFSLWHLHQNGFTKNSVRGLFYSGFTALLVILPWLYVVISTHGLAPLMAGLTDSKSPVGIIGSTNALPGFIVSTLEYIVNKHVNGVPNAISFLLFPFPLAIIYNLIKGPRILVLLLLSGLITMRGHPSVTIFTLAASLGIFYDKFISLLFNPEYHSNSQQRFSNLSFLVLFIFYNGALFILCLYYARIPSFSLGELETYNWIRENTKETSTFIAENMDEKLVHFGQRTILLPILGAEWIPDSEYGNWTTRNSIINSKIFKCRDVTCLHKIFTDYNLCPD